MRSLAKWLFGGVVGVAVVLALGALVTLRPGDPALWPAGPESKTITVFVVSHGYHAGIALPRVVAREVAGVHGLSALRRQQFQRGGNWCLREYQSQADP